MDVYFSSQRGENNTKQRMPNRFPILIVILFLHISFGNCYWTDSFTQKLNCDLRRKPITRASKSRFCFPYLDTNIGKRQRPNNFAHTLRMSASNNALRVGKLIPKHSALLLCDIQERFRPLIHRAETVIRTAQYLTSVAKELDVPVVGTQQYTKVFGPTVTDCFADGQKGLEETQIFDKKLFSMLTPEVKDHLKKLDKESFILVGIEAHVCVQQTCLDLLEMGKDVHIIVDGVSSQQPYDRSIALQRMSSAGAFLTTAQSAAFMLMQSAEHENFKAISKLTVEHMKLPNEFNDPLKDN